MRLRSLANASTVATFALIAIGGLVRATKSGLGCGTDWPDCSGRIIPVFGHPAVVIEYSHRLAAGAVVILLGLLAVTALARHRDHKGVVAAAVAAFFLVLAQAALGAVVVKLELEAESVIAHLALAMSLLALLVYLGVLIRAAEGRSWHADRGASHASTIAAAAVFSLLLVGSYLSGYEGAGRAFDDWPLMNGQLVPDLSVSTQAIHFLHRVLALAVGIVVAIATMRVVRHKDTMPEAARMAQLAATLFVVEVLIGAANVFTDLNAGFVTAHLAIGAAIWASLVAAAALTSSGREVSPQHVNMGTTAVAGGTR